MKKYKLKVLLWEGVFTAYLNVGKVEGTGKVFKA